MGCLLCLPLIKHIAHFSSTKWKYVGTTSIYHTDLSQFLLWQSLISPFVNMFLFLKRFIRDFFPKPDLNNFKGDIWIICFKNSRNKFRIIDYQTGMKTCINYSKIVFHSWFVWIMFNYSLSETWRHYMNKMQFFYLVNMKELVFARHAIHLVKVALLVSHL